MSGVASHGQGRPRWPFSLLIGAFVVSGYQLFSHLMGWLPSSQLDLGLFSLLIGALAFVTIGVVILRRLPRHRVAWVFVITGYSLILSGSMELIPANGSLAVDAVAGALWLSWLTLGGFVVLWFPTGKVPTERWRWVERLGYALLFVSISYAVAGKVCIDYAGDEYGGCLRFADNPIGVSWIPNPEFGPASGVTFAFLIGFLILAPLSLIVRYVRSSGVERAQLKWFAYAVAVSLAFDIVGFTGVTDSLPDPLSGFLFATQGIAKLGVPAAAAIAILRYRLFDIDRIVSRTVGYAVVLGSLGLLYAVGAIWLPSQMAGDSPGFVAGSTLAVAALFNPLRRRVLNSVDRRFYRAKYNSEKVVDSFKAQLRDQTDLDLLAQDWVTVVSDIMQPVSIGVWVKQR